LVAGLTGAEIGTRLSLDASTVAAWRAYDAELIQVVQHLRQEGARQRGEDKTELPPSVTTRMASFS